MHSIQPEKYSIAHCTYRLLNRETFPNDLAILGVLTLTIKGNYEADFTVLDPKLHLKKAICTGADLVGGIGPPAPEQAAELFARDNTDLINAFLDMFPYKRFILFDDRGAYSRQMLLLVMKLAKQKGKQITVIVVKTDMDATYGGRRKVKIFADYQAEVERYADEVLLLDLTSDQTGFSTFSMTDEVRKEIFAYVYERWKEYNHQH